MPSSSGRSRRSWVSVPVVAVLIAVFLKSYLPQPQLDLSAVSKLAAEAVVADQGAIPLGGIVVAVTGATSGIGRGLTSVLHDLGATIVAIGRSPNKLAALREELGQERIETFVADLTDLNSVARVANEITSHFDHLDYLVNNAGIHYSSDLILQFWSEQSTPQGYDVAFGVNYLSHYLLTEKLIPLLERSDRKSPRIVQMSSSFHWLSDGLDLTAVNGKPPRASLGDAKSFFHRERSYANSKLGQILHARALSRRFVETGSKVRAVSACPGWVGTKVGGTGLMQSLLEMIAYPNDGFGVASTCLAMFQPAAASGVDVDYYINSPVFEYLGDLVKKTAIDGAFRDALSWVSAITLLYVQRLSPREKPSLSSPESYNETIQDSLFRWSHTAVSEWL